MAVPLAERPKTPLELLTEAALTYAEADEHEAFERALDNLRQAAHRYSRRDTEVVSQEQLRGLHSELERVQAKLGRPPKHERDGIAKAVQRCGSQAKAARELGLSERTVRRAMRWIETHRTELVSGR